jgi:hypothetical protein
MCRSGGIEPQREKRQTEAAAALGCACAGQLDLLRRLLKTPMSTSTHTAFGRRLAIGRTAQMRTMIQNARHNGSDAVCFHASQGATTSERRKIIFNVLDSLLFW